LTARLLLSIKLEKDMKKSRHIVYLLFLLSLKAYPDDADIQAYEKLYFPDEVELSLNPGFISSYAKSLAKHASKKGIDSALIAKPGDHPDGSGDTAISGVIIKPGVDMRGVRNIYVVGNTNGNINVFKGGK
jgi:hypothetical protein